MALYDRLMGLAQPKIPVHQFMASLAERARSKMTNAQIITAFSLTASEQTELNTLVTNRIIPGSLTPDEVHQVLLLGEARIVPYDTVALIKTRFGV